MKIKMYSHKNCDRPVSRWFMGSLMYLATIVALWYCLIALLDIF
jgi:hypothetical protein